MGLFLTACGTLLTLMDRIRIPQVVSSVERSLGSR